MIKRLLLTLTATVALAGCGSPATSFHSIVAPPESSVSPTGPLNPSPPKPAAPPHLTEVTSQHIDAAGLHLIEYFENSDQPEYCPYYDEYGRVWTIGFGQTEGVTRYSRCISHAQAEANLQYLVETRYEWGINALGVPLTQNERDALCSFSWNLGAGIYEGTAVGYFLRTRQFYAATRVMLQYDHAGGVVLPGLKTRREAEVRLFLTPEPVVHPVVHGPSRSSLIAKREVLRSLERAHSCLLPPKYGGGRWHHPCTVWRQQGDAVDHLLVT